MAAGRWYPSVTPLRNGEMLITEGGPDMPEVRTTAGGLRALTTASLNLPAVPWIDVAPDGRAFYSGPDQTMRSLDTDGQRRVAGLRPARRAQPRLRQPRALRRREDPRRGRRRLERRLARDRHQRRDAAGVRRRRRWPTGAASTTSPCSPTAAVLATGGNSSGASLVDLNNGVYPAEQWNPATGQWKTLAPMQVTRQYHSTALLLPDGRVLSSGGGICGTCDAVGYLAKNAAGVHAAVPVQEGRVGRARAAPGRSLGARRGRVRHAVRRSRRRTPPRSASWRWSGSAP